MKCEGTKATAMRLIYLVPNRAYTFVMGDSPVRLEGEVLFFTDRRDAVDAARRHGLTIEPKGWVWPHSDELSGHELTREEFASRYTQKLLEAMARHPDDYADSDVPDAAPRIVGKMMRAIEHGSAHLSPALKATLRSFGLPTTYAGLNEARARWSRR